MAHVFQTTLPATEGAAIAQAILSRKFSSAMIRDAWVVAEYGLTQFTPGTEPAMAQAAGPAGTPRERELLKGITDADLVNAGVGDVKVAGDGAKK